MSTYRYSGRLKFLLPAGAVATATAGSGIGDVGFTGAVVAPDRTMTKVVIGQSETETIAIGNETWTRVNGGVWSAAAPSSGGAGAGGPGNVFNPQSFCRDYLTNLDASTVTPVPEQLNGIATLRYEFDRTAIDRVAPSATPGASGGTGGGGASDLPPNTKLVVWVTPNERWPVKLTLAGDRSDNANGLRFDVDFNVTNLNDREVRIEAPK